MSDFVTLKNINKNYGDYHASVDINFNIKKGRLVALLGPSGSGKTTILRMIAGLEQPDSGEILIDGKVVNDLPGSKRGIGFVFQNYALFRYMTVYDNIASGLKVMKMPKAQIKERVSELMKLVTLYTEDGWQPDVILLCCAELARRKHGTIAAVARELTRWREDAPYG